MNDRLREDGEWFAARRFGYGAGLPIAWQGWALFGGYLAVMAGIGWIAALNVTWLRIASLPLFIAATLGFIALAARHTRGGWKWRWGED